MTDQQILQELDQKRTSPNPGLNDGFFDDIWGGIEKTATDIWDGVSGNTSKKATEMVNKKIDEFTGYGDNQSNDPYLYQDQQYSQPAPVQGGGGKNIIEKIPPVAAGAGAAAIARFGAKLGWITSLAIGGATGAAKHYLIDKKKGAYNG